MTATTPSGAALRVLAVDDEKPALDELVYLLRAQPEVGEIHAARESTAARAADAIKLLAPLLLLAAIACAAIAFTWYAPNPLASIADLNTSAMEMVATAGRVLTAQLTTTSQGETSVSRRLMRAPATSGSGRVT